MATASEWTAASPHFLTCQRLSCPVYLSVWYDLPFHSRILHVGPGSQIGAGSAGHGKSPCLQSQSCSNSDTDSTHRHADHGGPGTSAAFEREKVPRSPRPWPSIGLMVEMHASPSSLLLFGTGKDTWCPLPIMHSQSHIPCDALPFVQKDRT